jgi:predicted AAA+ superfamily ATPase
MWIHRHLETTIAQLIENRPALLLTGVRQSGKTTLLKKVFPEAAYVSLDRPMVAQSAEENPIRFLEQFDDADQVIIDEIQYAPHLFRELKIKIDDQRHRFGRWILTGSQKFELMEHVSESLAGRLAIMHLGTLSAEELRQSGFFTDVERIVWTGGYPELWAYDHIDPEHFYDAYIQTYLERDLRQIINVTNLRDFQRLIRACAMRTGQLVNFSNLAKDVGVSANTVKSWLNVLETSGLIVLLPPYSANVKKRLVKAPKLYFSDTGVLCRLLNIRSEEALNAHIHEGNIWENFVFTELAKDPRVNRKHLFFYRDQNNVEIDFLIETGGRTLLVEAKSSEHVEPSKLNFSKVGSVIKGETNCVLACRHKEGSRISLKSYDAVNPMTMTVI